MYISGVCLEYALGTLHKRRILRGGRRGVPSKQMKGDENSFGPSRCSFKSHENPIKVSCFKPNFECRKGLPVSLKKLTSSFC